MIKNKKNVKNVKKSNTRQAKYSFETDEFNPISHRCILLTCRDLYTCVLSSLDVFNNVLTSQENVIAMRNNIEEISRLILLVQPCHCPWLIVMLMARPHPNTAELLDELISVVFLSAKVTSAG